MIEAANLKPPLSHDIGIECGLEPKNSLCPGRREAISKPRDHGGNDWRLHADARRNVSHMSQQADYQRTLAAERTVPQPSAAKFEMDGLRQDHLVLTDVCAEGLSSFCSSGFSRLVSSVRQVTRSAWDRGSSQCKHAVEWCRQDEEDASGEEHGYAALGSDAGC